MITSEHRGRRMNLAVYDNSVIPNTYTNVKLVDIFSFRTAVKSADVTAQHIGIYPSLPAGVSTDPSALTFFNFETVTGSEVILASEWINPASVEFLDGTRGTITLTSVTPQQLETVRLFLIQQGITEFFITSS